MARGDLGTGLRSVGGSRVARRSAMHYVCESMKLVLTTLAEGANPITAEIDPQRLELDEDVFQQPVRVTGDATWSGDHAQVRLSITAPGHFVCDRCAEPTARDILAETEFLVLMEDPASEEDDAVEDDGETPILFAGERGTVVDLTGEIVAALELAIPLRLLCRDECRGLCPVCYANLNEMTCEHAVDGETPLPESTGSAMADPSDDAGDDSGFGADVPTESIADKLLRKQNKHKNR